MAKPTIVLGLVGMSLDAGREPERWERWRPTVDVCRHDDLLISRFELLYDPKLIKLAEQVSRDIGSISPETKVRLWPVPLPDPWDFETTYGALYDFARDYPFEPEQEDYLIHITTGSHVWQICLFLLAETHHLPGRLLQASPPKRHARSGPGDYHTIDLDLARYDRLRTRFERETTTSLTFLKLGIPTRSPAFNRMIERIEQVAIATSDPLLLLGPTGAGKSQLARRIYDLKRSRRQVEGPFVEVNCATLRGDTAMATLFGHTLGAFTGAVADRPGLLRAADGGILFLDELGELGADEQAMLLRCVEDKRFLPVGADKEVESDFQLVAGTNHDLTTEVQQGRFRSDLLARIDVWTFKLPGLVERREDLEPNVDYELDRFAERTGRRITFNKEARLSYLNFGRSVEASWPANFRDLSGSVRRLATLATSGRITVALVEEELARLRVRWSGSANDSAVGDDELLRPLLGDLRYADLDPFDRVQLAEVVRVCQRSSSLSDAGRYLFQVSRLKKRSSNDADRLRKYLDRFGLDVAQIHGISAT